MVVCPVDSERIIKSALRQTYEETGVRPRDEYERSEIEKFGKWVHNFLWDRIWGVSEVDDGQVSERQWPGLNLRLINSLSAAVSMLTWDKVRLKVDSEAVDLVFMAGRLMESWHEVEERFAYPEQGVCHNPDSPSARAVANRATSGRGTEVRCRKRVVLAVPGGIHCGMNARVNAGSDVTRIDVDLGRDKAIFMAWPDEVGVIASGTTSTTYAELAGFTTSTMGGIASYQSRTCLFDAVREAREILHTCQMMNLPSRFYRLDDITLEVLIARSPDVAALLAERVDPLFTHGQELVGTLLEYLHNHEGNKQVANQLNIHQNTLSYRLRRIEQLTGLNPGKHRDAHILLTGCLSKNIHF